LHIYEIFLTLDPTQSDPPKTENFVTQPDQTRLDPTHGWTRPTSNSALTFKLDLDLDQSVAGR